MFDFAAMPPEVNSGRMYAGPGAGPMISAATAWDGLASDLSSAASSYQSVISDLTSGSWLGTSSTAMTSAATPYVEWMNTTAGQAEQTASQARTAAAAYETAFAATVPPTVIAANRSLLASLVASNILGQNTAAIAATEAHYGEMWAQDATAMYGYAGASASATQLTPFSTAPQTTNQSGAATQAAATSTSTGAQTAATSGAATNPLQALADLINEFNATPLGSGLASLSDSVGADNTFMSGYTFLACGPLFMLAPLMALALPNLGAGGGLVSSVTAPADALGAALADSAESGIGSASLAGGGISAGLGEAASVGGLSVPQAWGTAAPEIRLAAKALPMSALGNLPEAAALGAPSGFSGGMPMMGPIGSVVNAPRTGQAGLRNKGRPNVMAQLPGESGTRRHTVDRFLPPEARPDVTSALSERERDELDHLRRELTELELERDAAARLIKEAIRP